MILAFAGFLFAASDSVDKCEQKEKNRNTEQRSHSSRDWLFRFVHRRRVDLYCAGAADDVWVALSGIAVAFFTFTLWRSTEKLWRADQDRRIDFERSLEISHRTALASEKATEIARRSLIDVQRALVIPTRFMISQVVHGKTQQVLGYRLMALMKNTGPTVALNYCANANIVVFPGKDLPERYAYPDRKEIDGSTSTVGPGVEFPFPLDIAIQDIVEIASEAKSGFIYGWMEYDDVFPDTSRRRTEFCVKIEVFGEPMHVLTQGEAPALSCRPYGNYNFTDERCFYKPGQKPPIGGLPPPTQPPPE